MKGFINNNNIVVAKISIIDADALNRIKYVLDIMSIL